MSKDFVQRRGNQEIQSLYVINSIVLTGITNNEIAHHIKKTGTLKIGNYVNYCVRTVDGNGDNLRESEAIGTLESGDLA